MDILEGTISRIIYHNEENGYSVLEIETDDELWDAVGEMLMPTAGKKYRFEGEFRVHRKYGEQFAFSSAEEVLPESRSEIEEFLASGSVRGVGEKTAAAIVGEFGEDTLRVMQEEPEKLTQVPGIGKKKAAVIAESLAAQMAFVKVSLFFQKYGISSRQAMKLYRAYGTDAVELIREDPYRLISDIYGIGFRKADEIGMKLGIPPDDPKRIRSGIRFCLNRCLGDGSTCFPLEDLRDVTAEMLDLTREQIDAQLEIMAFQGDIKIEKVGGVDCVYLYYMFLAEKKVAANILAISGADIEPISEDTDFIIRETEERKEIRLSAAQEEAVRRSIDKGMAVITGGPGTGKSTIINTILNLMDGNGLTCAVAAPTGRAAKRITETTGREASTIHRLLGYAYDDDENTAHFEKDRDDPLLYDAVIIDEASMIDLLLMQALTEAIRPGSRLILVGDADQLPAVGAGDVLRDIIESGMVSVIHLTEVFRQAEESDIVMNAHRINHGEYPVVNRKGTDFFLVRVSSGEPAIRDTVIDLVLRRLPNYYQDLDPLRDIQVLTPLHRGPVGTDSLNAALQEAMNPKRPDAEEKTYAGRIFRTGDKVMQIRNNYQLAWTRAGDPETHEGVYNGDVGFIHSIDTENELLTVVYDDDKFAQYDFSDLDELELAYAITVHKSQGSEFPLIVMPVSAFPPMLASRNLLYTAITRGKRGVILVGEERRLRAMVDNNRVKMRCSGLGYRLDSMHPFVE
jgi:exodeoxyribonuclease V alpha subunit